MTVLEAMIDIETLDTGPRSVVLSIGAVKFDSHHIEWRELNFFATLELDRQFDRGRSVSQATLLWWGSQGDAWLKSFSPLGRLGPHTALLLLNDYLQDVECVWANPPQFDCTILDTLHADELLKPPWDHRQLRDMRTLREEAGVPRDWKPSDWVGTDHDPVDDCHFQIRVVFEARRRIALCLQNSEA